MVQRTGTLTYKVRAEGSKRVEHVNADRLLPFRTREEVLGVPVGPGCADADLGFDFVLEAHKPPAALVMESPVLPK